MGNCGYGSKMLFCSPNLNSLRVIHRYVLLSFLDDPVYVPKNIPKNFEKEAKLLKTLISTFISNKNNRSYTFKTMIEDPNISGETIIFLKPEHGVEFMRWQFPNLYETWKEFSDAHDGVDGRLYVGPEGKVLYRLKD